jgi:cytochrome c-type biogenesis protein CcmH
MIILTVISFNIFAAIDVYQFKDEEKQHRFQTLVTELRCPKCQNQNLADSNSEIATDLRMKVYQMLEKDKSDEVIIDYMLERYGEFVLYKPRVSGQTLLLWYGPILLLLIGLIIIGLILRHRFKKIPENDNQVTLDQQQQQTLATLLNTNNEKK